MKLFARVGIPKEILMDQGSNFTSQLLEINKLDKLQTRWKNRQSSIIEGLYMLKYRGDEVTSDTGITIDENRIGAPYVQKLLRLFVSNFPVVSYQEVQIECGSSKKVVGGSIDICVGNPSNGSIVIDDHERLSIFLGCLGEAKAADVPIARLQHEATLNDTKTAVQPMLEALAVGELTHFPNNTVPLLNFLANKTAFRPFLYWRECDVILTTPRAIPLRRSESEVDIQGLLLLFVLFQLNSCWQRCIG